VHHVPGTYSTIQAALNACLAGDTVLVASGTYSEHIVWPATQSILLKSESGAAVTTIDGGGTGRVIGMDSGVDNTTIIDGFTIKNGYAEGGGGIVISYSSPTIQNNIITQNVTYGTTFTGGGGGIAAVYNSSPVIVGNVFSYNSATANGAGGFGCLYNCDPVIDDNLFEYNSALWGGGLFIGNDCSALVTNNIVRYNNSTEGGGMYFQASSSIAKFNAIEYNTATETGGGIEFGFADVSLIDSNTIRYNTANLYGGGIGLHGGVTPIISNNIISGDSAIHGGGIYCTDNSNPLIINNNIYSNEADSVGGGILCSYSSSPTIQYNTIDNNTSNLVGGGGICVAYNSSPLIKENDIINNKAYTYAGGGGILIVEDSHPTIDGDSISGNYANLGGGGILIYEGCSAHIINNTITNNIAQGGGGLCFQTSTGVIKYNLIKNNTGSIQGAGMEFLWGSQAVVDSNDISDNYGEGIFCKENSTPILHWNTICGHSPNYGVRNIDPSVTVDATNNWWGDPTGPYHAVLNPGGLCNPVSDYVLFDPWIIPVELTSFTAAYIAGEVLLNWTTATEVNNLGFEIERRIINNEAQGEWTLIGFRGGYGTTSEPKEYSYTDNINGIKATSFAYRLKQIDFNGTYEYSAEVFVDNFTPIDFVLEQNYPNPFNPSTTIAYGIPVKSHITLKVYNALGKEVVTLVNEEQAPEKYQVVLNAINLASGVYFYKLNTGGFIETKKMLLLK
jgi:parallel beta-helix repeat protein